MNGSYLTTKGKIESTREGHQKHQKYCPKANHVVQHDLVEDLYICSSGSEGESSQNFYVFK